MDNKELENLKAKIANLESDLKNNLEELKLHKLYVTNININFEQKITDIHEKHKDLNEKCNHIYSIKEHIFATLAFFFGIFVLISIDIGITKSIFSSINSEKTSIQYFSVALSFIIILQIAFCVAIYCFLIHPFLKKSIKLNEGEKHIKLTKICKVIPCMLGLAIIIVFLTLVFIHINNLDYKCSELEKKYSDLQTQFTLKNENSKLKSDILSSSNSLRR